MKQMAIQLLDEAVQAGARQHQACAVLGIPCRTLLRWRSAQSLIDRRKGAQKHGPHALSEIDRQRILRSVQPTRASASAALTDRAAAGR